MKIRKAVIPVAGKGTRFLPATKQIPKEMIPIINIPMIQYVVEEAAGAGIEQIIFVTSGGKEAIENYFDRNHHLETFLSENKKGPELELVKKIGTMIEVVSVRQKEQLGLGHAILCAEAVVGDEDFAVLLGDDLIRNDGGLPVTKQLVDVYGHNKNRSVIGVMEVDRSQTNRYGIVDGEFFGGQKKTLKMKAMVEKPKPEVAPTNLATPGRYILTNGIFDCLKRIPRGVGGEYQLTDAINMLAKEEDVFAHIFEGERYDTGSIQGYLDAVVDFALRERETKEMMIEIMRAKKKKFNLSV